MNAKEPQKRLIVPNDNPDACLYTLTKRYLEFLGADYQGSLQPTCRPGYPNRPHLEKCIVYSLALADLRQVIIILLFYPLHFVSYSYYSRPLPTLDLRAICIQNTLIREVVLAKLPRRV